MLTNVENEYNKEMKKNHKKRIKVALLRVSLMAMFLIVSTYGYWRQINMKMQAELYKKV